MPTPQNTSPTRKDAARNRSQLLRAAEELLSTQGLEVSLKEIAKHAGVGVGTVYRHFPTKDDLIATLFAEQLEAEVRRARAAAETGDAWQALVTYLEDSMRLQAANRALRSLMCPTGPTFDTVRECKATINPYLKQVVALAHAQGTLRTDCTAKDIALLQVALVGIMNATPNEHDAYQHHLELFLNGVRVDPPQDA